MVQFKDLHLNNKILNTLDKKGYSTPTLIQEKAIPHLLNKKDLLGIAQTGTGKTAAFSLPILHNLCENKVRARSKEVRALILTPTRELASQVVDSIRDYSQDLGLRYTTVFGGVSIHNQVRNLQKGLDIVVATPGRLLDLYKQKKIFFGQLEVLVLDEADRMLDMGFLPDVKRIIDQLPKERQTMLFSATMPQDIASLASSMLVKPVMVEIKPEESSVKKISQTVYRVAKADKASLLNLLLKKEQIEICVIFSKTKHGADKIVKFLEGQDIKADAIHGDKSQNVRERILRDFRRGKKNVLVATDIAARGIDVPGITHVINYDMPQDAESYVHRIGRTGRAGREGFAISFCDNSEVGMLRSIEKLTKGQIEIEENHPYHVKSSGSSSGGGGSGRSRSNSGFSKSRRGGDKRGSTGSGRKFGDRDSASGSKRKFGDRDSASGSGRKFGDRDSASGSGRKFGDRDSASGSGRKFGDRDSASGSGRKFGDRDSASGSGRKFGDRDSASGSKRKFGDRDSASGSGRKFGYRDSASGSKRKFGDRDSASGSKSKFGGRDTKSNIQRTKRNQK